MNEWLSAVYSQRRTEQIIKAGMGQKDVGLGPRAFFDRCSATAMSPLPSFWFPRSSKAADKAPPQSPAKPRFNLSCISADTIPSIDALRINDVGAGAAGDDADDDDGGGDDGCDSIYRPKHVGSAAKGASIRGTELRSSPPPSPPHSKGRRRVQSPVTRKNFYALKNARPEERFTNHESIPSLDESYANFIRVYPEYMQTEEVDQVRVTEYAYLNENGNVFLDYCGYGLLAEGLGVSYIAEDLPTHALYGGAEKGTVEHDIKQRIYRFLNLQESEYSIVFTSSQESAFKLLAESYPFHTKRKLLTVYDYECEAVSRMEETAKNKGAMVMNANFRWPSQALCITDLRKKLQIDKKKAMMTKKKQKKSKEEEEEDDMGFAQGLLVFPVLSRVTGARYSYQWMYQAQENGWEVLLDASALMPKALGALGLSVFHPDFIVTSFFKVYGLDPTGFGCLLIKRCAVKKLLSTSAARGVGMVRLIPTPMLLSEDERCFKGKSTEGNHVMCSEKACPSTRGCNNIDDDDDDDENADDVRDDSGGDNDGDDAGVGAGDDDDDSVCEVNRHYAFGVCNRDILGPYSQPRKGSSRASCNQVYDCLNASSSYSMRSDATSAVLSHDEESPSCSSSQLNDSIRYDVSLYTRKEPEITCRGLDHAETLGYSKTNIRYRCLINWLVTSMLKLQHPGLTSPNPLIQIYGPKLKFDRGPAVAFNLFDWRGNLLHPLLVQKLADRSSISIGVSTLHHLKHSSELKEKLNGAGSFSLREVSSCGSDWKCPRIGVVTIALGFLSNYEDVYKFWAFLAKFLDADFVSKEVWRYRSLNQETVILGGQ